MKQGKTIFYFKKKSATTRLLVVDWAKLNHPEAFCAGGLTQLANERACTCQGMKTFNTVQWRKPTMNW